LIHPKLKETIGLDEISYSQLSRALKALDTTASLEFFYQLVTQVQHHIGYQQNEELYLIDSRTFTFSQPLYLCAQFRKTKSGVKLHLKVCFMEDGMLRP